MRHWTTGQARRLRELRSQRVPAKQIADELGRTVDAIYAFLRYVPATKDASATVRPVERLPRMERKRDRWSPQELVELRSLAENGHSPRETSDIIRRTYRAVIKKASDEGIAFYRAHQCSSVPRFDPETVRYIRDAEIGSRRLRDAILALAA